LFSVVITSANRCQMGVHGYPGSGGVFARRWIGAGLIAFGAWTGLLAGAAAARGEARMAVCDPIVVFGADTEAGRVTLLSGELIASGAGP
jgi:hypothetical protein